MAEWGTKTLDIFNVPGGAHRSDVAEASSCSSMSARICELRREMNSNRLFALVHGLVATAATLHQVRAAVNGEEPNWFVFGIAILAAWWCHVDFEQARRLDSWARRAANFSASEREVDAYVSFMSSTRD